MATPKFSQVSPSPWKAMSRGKLTFEEEGEEGEEGDEEL